MDEFIYCYVIQKWDYPSHSYLSIPITSREPLNIKTYSEDMNEIVNCCQCLKRVRYGDTYTSKEIHTNLGFGFAVCEDCYEEEWNVFPAGCALPRQTMWRYHRGTCR